MDEWIGKHPGFWIPFRNAESQQVNGGWEFTVCRNGSYLAEEKHH
jgi:hypothetical protein